MMTGVQFNEVWTALYTGYSKNSLRQMLKTRLDTELDDIVGDGPMKDMAFDLLSSAEREGWEVDLVREAYRFNPRNRDLLSVYQKYGLAPEASVQQGGVPQGAAAASSDGLERTVRSHLKMVDIEVWRERMSLLEARVCRVEVNGNAMGTGFLVGPDAVLTNYHVTQKVLEGATPPTALGCRFDYKVLKDGSRSPGVAVGLHATDWRIDDSPYTREEAAAKPDDGLPTPDQLDYSLLRLARPLADESVATRGTGGPPRGWVEVPPAAETAFSPGMPLLIIQHPDGSPLKLAFDSEAVIGVNGNGTRVRYATNTEPGSSGSPCFDIEWNLVALHHYGDPAFGHPKYNQGVPVAAIRERLRRQGKEGALGGASP